MSEQRAGRRQQRGKRYRQRDKSAAENGRGGGVALPQQLALAKRGDSHVDRYATINRTSTSTN
jgi:hypothetical protein